MNPSRDHLEYYADEALREYRYRLRPHPLDRIDMNRLAEDVLGLKMEYHCLSMEESILGMTCGCHVFVETFDLDGEDPFIELDGRTILIESGLFDGVIGRRHFTEAHEIAHQILYRRYPRENDQTMLRVMYRDPSGNGRDSAEWAADTMAAFLLLPECLVRSCADYIGIRKPIVSLNDGDEKLDEPGVRRKFMQIAEHLEVSQQALAIRFFQLGLLEKRFIRPKFGNICVP